MYKHLPELTEKLQAALQEKGPGYSPRTRHLHRDGSPVYTNRLILEDSPYLLQHAHNPVDWHAWGTEAFEVARSMNMPVFLSIGYSTCHWCHVMEEESFDNEEIAALLNEHFIPIKVDREQRPDIDNIYMTGVLLVAGQGGWPMSNFLTPDGDPFFAGTYFPPPQFADLLQRIHLAWRQQQADLEQQAARITEAIRTQGSAREGAQALSAQAVDTAVRSLLASHDNRLGGFNGAPKFPQESAYLLLLSQLERHHHPEIGNALHVSLQAMANGGIHDQVGGGFHRYCVDDQWLVPHFEEMLYNQAQLTRVYTQAWRLTGESGYRRVAQQIIDYVLRDMCSPQGTFYSATDADSEGEEGLFFVWTPAQLREALPEDLAKLAMDIFQISEGGNFEGRSILHLPTGLEELARQKGMALEELLAKVEQIRAQLYEVREQRIHPLRDDKILTAWNGMMITAIAEAADAFGAGPRQSDKYRQAAIRAADSLWQHSRKEDGRLWRIYLNGSASVDGMQEDYACLGEACIVLYDLTADDRWLQRARELCDRMNSLFWDEASAGGGYFMSPAGQDGPMPTRFKESHDGATPSGNSVAVRVLARLYARTGEAGYRNRAEKTLQALAEQVHRSPPAFAYLLTAADELMHGEQGPRRYAGEGRLRIEFRRQADQVLADIAIADGWHINAHEAVGQERVQTELIGDAIEQVEYPEADNGRYRGNIRINGQLQGSHSAGECLALKLQACSDELCLAPETLKFRLM